MGNQNSKFYREQLEWQYYSWEYEHYQKKYYKDEGKAEGFSEIKIIRDGIDRRLIRILMDYYQMILYDTTTDKNMGNTVIYFNDDLESDEKPGKKEDIIRVAGLLDDYLDCRNKRGVPVYYGEVVEYYSSNDPKEKELSIHDGLYFKLDLDHITRIEFELYKSLISALWSIGNLKSIQKLKESSRRKIQERTHNVFRQRKWKNIITPFYTNPKYKGRWFTTEYNEKKPRSRLDFLKSQLFMIQHECDKILEAIDNDYLFRELSDYNKKGIIESLEIKSIKQQFRDQRGLDACDSASSASILFQLIDEEEFYKLDEIIYKSVKSISKKLKGVYDEIMSKSIEELSHYSEMRPDMIPFSEKERLWKYLVQRDENKISEFINRVWYDDKELKNIFQPHDWPVEQPDQVWTMMIYENYTVDHLGRFLGGLLKGSGFEPEYRGSVEEGLMLYNLKSERCKYIISVIKTEIAPSDLLLTMTMFRSIKENYLIIDPDVNIMYLTIVMTSSELVCKIMDLTYQSIVDGLFTIKRKPSIEKAVSGVRNFWKSIECCMLELTDFVDLFRAIYMVTSEVGPVNIQDEDSVGDVYILQDNNDLKNILMVLYYTDQPPTSASIDNNMRKVVNKFYAETSDSDTEYYHVTIDHMEKTLDLKKWEYNS